MTTSKNQSLTAKVKEEYRHRIMDMVEQRLRAIYPHRSEEEWEDRWMMDSDYAGKIFYHQVEMGKTPEAALEVVRSFFPIPEKTATATNPTPTKK